MKISHSSMGAFICLSFSILLASLSAGIANVALPTLIDAFHASFHQVQWVVIAYLLAVTTLIVSIGRLGDTIGHRRVLLFGIVLFTAASVLCGIAPTLGLLILARVAQGLGAAIMLVLAMASVHQAVTKEKIGSAMGVLATMSAFGTALGPTLGGFLIYAFGWQAIFFVTAPLGVLLFILTYYYFPTDHGKLKTTKVSFDMIGMLLLALTLAAYSLAMTLGHGQYGILNLGLLIVAIGGFIAFVIVEKRIASPLVQIAIFHNRTISGGFVMSVLVLTVMMAIFVIGPFYLAQALGLDTAHVGLIMSVGPLAAAISGIPAGRLTDKFGASLMMMIGIVVIGLGSLVIAVFPLRIFEYALCVGFISSGYSLFQTGNNTAVMMGVAQDQKGVVSGLLNLSRNLGLITGASVMAAIFAYASGTTDKIIAKPDAVIDGVKMTFMVATGLMIIAFAIAATNRQRSE